MKFVFIFYTLFVNLCLCFAECRYEVINFGKVNVTAINNLGEVIGHEGDNPFIWRPSTGKEFLASPSQSKSWALDINDHSQILGSANGMSCIWENGLVKYLTKGGFKFNNKGQFCKEREYGINDHGDRAGQNQHKAYLNNQEIITVNSKANEINNFKQVVGSFTLHYYGRINQKFDVISTRLEGGGPIMVTRPGISGFYNAPVHAFLWQDNSFIDLGTLGGEISEALDINDRQQIVGFSATGKVKQIPPTNYSIGICHAFLWDGTHMINLNDLIDDKSIELKCAIAINNAGQILAYGLKDTVVHAVLLNPVVVP